jgi:diaminopropionate ammonia-lyase
MRQLADPRTADIPVFVGASGAAGVGAVLASRAVPEVARLLGTSDTDPARVLTIATEGVTEPALWSEVTGINLADSGR